MTGVQTCALPISLPPDQLTAAGLSFYLYHLAEDPHFKNAPPPDPAAWRARYSPMALSMSFQMSATPGGATSSDLLESQLLMGCAVKALHDQPVIDDTTEVAGAEILQLAGIDGADNRLRLSLQPMAPSDAVTYWTAGAQAVRLASYYQCSVVMLEPETLDRRAGRVFRYGVTTFVTGSPRLTGSRARLAIVLPDGAGETIEVSPATVPYETEFTLQGHDLAGEATELALRGGPGGGERTADASWALSAQPTEVTAIARRTADAVAMLPGIYSASVRVLKTMHGRAHWRRSNETPIQLAPNITAITPAGSLFRVDGGVFDDPGLAAGDRQVFLGQALLALVAGAPGPGEYRIVDPTRIELAPPAGAASGADLPLRIIVNGAETPPRWIRVP